MDLKQGYKQSEVGVIPVEWEVKALGDCAKFRTGPFGSALHKSDYTEDGVPVVNPMHIIDGQIKPTRTMTITEKAAKGLSDFRLNAGEIIIGRRGEMGRCAVVLQHQTGWLCGTGSMIVRCGEIADANFLQRLLSSPPAIAAIEDTSVGTTMINLNQGTLGGLILQIPPLPEQRAIAEALSDVDGLLGGLDRLIAKKRDLKQAAMQQLLTGQTRLPGFHGEWEAAAFAKIVRHHAGNSTLIKGKLAQSPAAGLFPGFSASGQDVWCDRYEHEGDAIIVSAVGSRCGKAFATTGRWCAIANTHVVWPNENKVDKRFLGLYINDEDFWLKSGSGQPFVLFKQTFARPVLLPPLPEQTAIAAVLSDMDAELAALEERREKTRQLKQGMMQELLTGRTRLV
jgi:type I restriction enzyme S subunit